MKVFGKGPRSLPKAGGALARALAACLLLESKGTVHAAPTPEPGHILEKPGQSQLAQPATTPPAGVSSSTTPSVQRGGFGNIALTPTELDEAIAGGLFMSLVGGVFWWESRPPRKKRSASS